MPGCSDWYYLPHHCCVLILAFDRFGKKRFGNEKARSISTLSWLGGDLTGAADRCAHLDKRVEWLYTYQSPHVGRGETGTGSAPAGSQVMLPLPLGPVYLEKVLIAVLLVISSTAAKVDGCHPAEYSLHFSA